MDIKVNNFTLERERERERELLWNKISKCKVSIKEWFKLTSFWLPVQYLQEVIHADPRAHC
jgi:hypothetical protein